LPTGWPATLAWSGYDRFLHPRWGRRANEPLYLYRFDRSPSRVYLRDAKGQAIPGSIAEIRSLEPHRVEIHCTAPVAAEMTLTDLDYPGWSATLDGQPAARVGSSIWRSLQVPAGDHVVVWTYRSDSFYLGRLIAAATLLIGVGLSTIPIALQRLDYKTAAARQQSVLKQSGEG
jgi:hypothetical protein